MSGLQIPRYRAGLLVHDHKGLANPNVELFIYDANISGTPGRLDFEAYDPETYETHHDESLFTVETDATERFAEAMTLLAEISHAPPERMEALREQAREISSWSRSMARKAPIPLSERFSNAIRSRAVHTHSEGDAVWEIQSAEGLNDSGEVRSIGPGHALILDATAIAVTDGETTLICRPGSAGCHHAITFTPAACRAALEVALAESMARDADNNTTGDLISLYHRGWDGYDQQSAEELAEAFYDQLIDEVIAEPEGLSTAEKVLSLALPAQRVHDKASLRELISGQSAGGEGEQ